MSYEVRDGVLWDLDPDEGGELWPIEDHVADALDVLRAAGWTVESEYEDDGPGAPYSTQWAERGVARSPWREVEKR